MSNSQSGNQEPTNPHSKDPPPANQAPPTDWAAVANLVSTALIKAANPTPPEQKPKLDWIAWLSLAVSASSVLASVLLGIFGNYYVNSRIEEEKLSLQETLVAYQNDISKATIQISSDCFLEALGCSQIPNDELMHLTDLQGGSVFSITNIGPAAAKTISINVGLLSPNGDFKSLHDFTIASDPPNASGLSIKPTDTAFQLTLNTQLNQANERYRITLDHSVHLHYRSEKVTLSLHSKNSPDFDYRNFGIPFVIGKFFETYFHPIQFNIKLNCDNCSAEVISIVQFPSFQDLMVHLTPQNALASEWAGTVNIGYIVPDASGDPASFLPSSVDIHAEVFKVDGDPLSALVF